MTVKQASNFCNVCQRQTLYQKPRINHILHLILSIITFGLWTLVWIILGIRNADKPMRCASCGTPKGFGTDVAAAPPLPPGPDPNR